MASSSSFVKFSLFFALLVVTVLCSPVLTETESESSELDLALSVATSVLQNEKLRSRVIGQAVQMVSQHPEVHRISKRATEVLAPTARLLFPAGPVLAGITLFGSFKAAVMLLGSVFFATTFMPSIASSFGLVAPAIPFRSLTESMNELRNVNYETVARSLDTLQKKSYLLDLQEEPCKNRAICEVGEFVAENYPTVTFWLQNMAGIDKLILGDQYSLSMIKGMKHQNCTRLFPKCSQDTYPTLNEIVQKLK